MRPSVPYLAYVVHSLNPGGTERLVVDMAVHFSEFFKVTVYCLDEPGIWADSLRRRGIAVYCLWRQPGFDLGISFRMARLFRRHGIDLIHAHQCTPWFYSALSRIGNAGPRLLLEEHGRFFPERKKIVSRLLNKLIISKLTHGFVSVSRDIRQRLVQFEGLRRDRIQVIHNGVAAIDAISAEARQELRSSLGFSVDEFIVGTVGRFDAIKNLPLLITALTENFHQFQKLRGLIVGDGPEYSAIEALVRSTPQGDRIRLTGFRNDAKVLVQCMDLFVLSSFSEGTSMALLEAVASGIPAVVTDVGGNPEIVEADVSGWVIASGDTDALVAAIAEAQQQPHKAKQFASMGLKKFEEKFLFSTMIGSYKSLYEKLLAQP